MMGNPIEVSKAVKFEENPISTIYSCDREGSMELATNSSDINKPGKKSKKNKKKKANLLKNHHLDANAASKSPDLVNTHCSSIKGSDCEASVRGPDECKQFNATISLKSSKEDSPMNFGKFDDSCNKEVKVTDPGLEFISPTGWDQMDSCIDNSGEFEAKPAVSSSCHDGSGILENGSYAPSSYGTKRLNSNCASHISRDKHKQFRNKNTRFIWRKTGRKTGSIETCGINRSYLGDGLLPHPEFSYAFRNGLQHRAKELGINNGEVKQKSWGQAEAVLTEWAFGHSFHAAFGQKLPIPVNGFWGKSSQRLDQPINVEKNICYDTGFCYCMSNLHRPRFGPYISFKGNLRSSGDQRSYIDGQRISHRNHRSSFDSSELYHFGFAPLAGRTHMQINEMVPTNGHVLGEALNISRDYPVKSLKHLEIGHPYALHSGDCFTDKIASIDNRNSMPKASMHCKETEITEKRDSYEEKCFKDSKSDHCGSYFNQNGLSIGIFSEKATQALVAAYRLQIACENVQNATGSPIAEFEKVLCSASPVIVSSFDKSLNEDAALRDVWSWYEGPGNYGLEVKAEDLPQTSEGVERKATSFRAYFVPLLSAVQLFDPLKPSCVDSSTTTNCLSHDSEVIFEYFEHEPPQNRKPLYTKIKEIIEDGSSNSRVFGNTSKLDCMKLRDVHPASWYSVAWYPIYRIPEGSLHAAFLTYHSLGHLVFRHSMSDSVGKSPFCVESPVLGMQSYNTQGECWFRSMKSTGSVSIEGKQFDFSELVKERLRALEETAAVFARGNVQKNHKIAANTHPDYEFFISRKR